MPLLPAQLQMQLTLPTPSSQPSTTAQGEASQAQPTTSQGRASLSRGRASSSRGRASTVYSGALADPRGDEPSVRNMAQEKYFYWNPEHHVKVREYFMKLASKRYRDLMFAMQGAKEKPSWILDDVYTRLREYWKSDKFVAIFEVAAKNQNEARGGKGPSKHTTVS
ncbi:hypothetical protein M9H77_20793 [Catharanthus roseus]|uniref:Uncharacterized protein n=1 Tax=Catharanthus roseus TaxID=4058 RepID=A0ACC0AM65_CATRO|nr:hypothetical protein M9H77_20793 [Catharanthus roseus]